MSVVMTVQAGVVKIEMTKIEKIKRYEIHTHSLSHKCIWNEVSSEASCY